MSEAREKVKLMQVSPCAGQERESERLVCHVMSDQIALTAAAAADRVQSNVNRITRGAHVA